jgi:hypothetical protein
VFGLGNNGASINATVQNNIKVGGTSASPLQIANAANSGTSSGLHKVAGNFPRVVR